MSENEHDSHCHSCDDSGWWPHECDGVHAMCGRKQKHLPHSYSVECPCRPTNRRYQQRIHQYWRVA